jgi:type IV fimbrial biogenesis protein FimT
MLDMETIVVKQRARKQRGYTLAELMTTLTVVGVSLSFAIPTFMTVVNNNRRATAVNQLVSTMHLARSEAVTRNLQVTICPSTDGIRCEATPWEKGWLAFPDLDSDRQVDANEVVIATGNDFSNIDISTIEFPTFLVYRPNGRVMVNNIGQNTGQLTFCDKRGADHARVVVINSSGQPRLSEYQMDGSKPVCN